VEPDVLEAADIVLDPAALMDDVVTPDALPMGILLDSDGEMLAAAVESKG